MIDLIFEPSIEPIIAASRQLRVQAAAMRAEARCMRAQAQKVVRTSRAMRRHSQEMRAQAHVADALPVVRGTPAPLGHSVPEE